MFETPQVLHAWCIFAGLWFQCQEQFDAAFSDLHHENWPCVQGEGGGKHRGVYIDLLI